MFNILIPTVFRKYIIIRYLIENISNIVWNTELIILKIP